MTAADITAGAWVRFPSWDQWRYVRAARHTPFSESEPRGSGFVQYDASDSPTDRFSTFGGFAPHEQECLVVTVTPQVVAHV